MTPPTLTSNTTDSVSTTAGARRELAIRENDGITVQLFWESDVDALTLTVEDRRAGIFFELPVARDRGLEAFHHPFPYAYAAGFGVGDAYQSLDLQPQT
jgi:hypothetical protein